MFSRDNDDPEDPRRFRRSLVPLDIEDAERPPSFFKRLARLFHKKKREPASAAEEQFPAGNEPLPLPAAQEKNGAPPDDAFGEGLGSETGGGKT